MDETSFVPPDDISGKRIGKYSVISLLGEGSFGKVYLAEQLHPFRRRVALKLIKPEYATKDWIARFESERQILADMNHPGIAVIYDAEQENGHPYFAMEFVENATPITQFCDERKLTIEQRLRLFADICEAAHHAHVRNIIHRDLKPSNMLAFDRDGKLAAKLIDFGIAKALNEPTGADPQTAVRYMLCSPGYASPEQLSMKPVDRHSDIYSLGVLLYELITGVRPFEFPQELPIGDVAKIVRDVPAPRPTERLYRMGTRSTTVAENRSTTTAKLRHRLQAGLDTIILKALSKKPEDRYTTAQEFAEAINGYLRIRAVRRQRRILAGASIALLVSLAVVGRLIVSNRATAREEQAKVTESQEALRKEQAARRYSEGLRCMYTEPARAVREFDAAFDLDNSLYDALIRKAYTLSLLRRENEAIAVGEAIISERGGSAASQLLMAQLLQVRNPEKAKQHREKGRLLLEQITDRYMRALVLNDDDANEAIALLKAEISEFGLARFEVGITLARRYLATRRFAEMLELTTRLSQYHPNLPEAWNLHGLAQSRNDKLEEAIDSFAKAIKIAGDSPGVLLNMANVRLKLERPKDAAYELKHRKHAKDEAERALKLDDQLPGGYWILGIVQTREREFDKARANFTRTLDLQPTFAEAWYHLADLSYQEDKYDESELEFTKAIEANSAFAAAYVGRARVHAHEGRYDAAIVDFDEALKIEPNNIYAMMGRARVHVRVDRLDAAIDDLNKSLELEPNRTEALIDRARIFAHRGSYTLAMDDLDKALQEDPQCIEGLQERSNLFANRLKRFEDALLDVDRIIVSRNDDARAHIQRGIIQRALFRYDQYLVDAKKAVDFATKDEKTRAAALAQRGFAQILNGNLDSAIADFESSLTEGEGKERILVLPLIVAQWRLIRDSPGDRNRATELLETATKTIDEARLKNANDQFAARAKQLLQINRAEKTPDELIGPETPNDELGSNFYHAGACALARKEFESALLWFEKAVQTGDRMSAEYHLAKTYAEKLSENAKEAPSVSNGSTGAMP